MKIEVIGRGNVGSQFARIFGVKPIAPRTLDGMSEDADLYIIAVSDSAVEEVANKMPQVKGVVVHTTGSVTMDVLSKMDCKGYGVLYPFQTISKQRPLPPSSIPLLVEACDDDTALFINDTARKYGFDKIQLADSETRQKIHLAGTFACNFTNAMIAISQKILEENGIDTVIVKPLIAETIEKLKTIPASKAQTGPAIRKDKNTLEKHLALLSEMYMNEECEIYTDISDYIMKKI